MPRPSEDMEKYTTGKLSADIEIVDASSAKSLPQEEGNNYEVDDVKSSSKLSFAAPWERPFGSKQDEALAFVASHVAENNKEFSVEEDEQLVRKIDRHLMPIMFGIYFLQLMDKQTLSFSSVFGISRDADLVGDDYSLLGSIVYIAQLIVQPLSAYLLVRLRLSIYIPVIVTCWGATLACMAAARNFTGLLVARFFLGGFEASIQAAFIITTQIWYRRHEQGFRLAVWYSNNGWVNIFGSLIMFGLGHIKSGMLHPYQIVFLLLGAVTLLVGLLSFWVFPDNPVRCKFLTIDEKVKVIERIRANQQGLESKIFKLNQALEMLLDLKSWCWMALMFFVSLPSGGITTFGPLIIRGFGFDGKNVMLLMIPFGALQVMVLFTGFWANRRFRKKSPIILAGLLPCIVASVILLCTGRSRRDQPILLVAFYLLAAYNVTAPTIINWQSSNVAGHTKKSTSIALMTTGLISGNIVGPLLFTQKDKPYYHTGVVAMLVCFISCALLVVFTVVYLWHLNGDNRKRRIAKGKAGKMVDYSMLSSAEAEKQRVRDAGAQVTGRHAFEDLTDLQNDEFIYVY